MNEIKDNPPPLRKQDHPRDYWVWLPEELEFIKAREAAAFARGVAAGQDRIDKLLDLVHVMRTELVKNNIEIDRLTAELGNLPEAQAEMLSTIKHLEAGEPDCRTCKNYLDCRETYNWRMNCTTFSQYKRADYTPLCEITS